MDHRQLLSDLLTAFDEWELKEICSNIQVIYEQLEGNDRGERAHHLIVLTAQQGRQTALAQAMVTLRPELEGRYSGDDELSWLDKVAMGRSAPADELPTQRWADSNQLKSDTGLRNDDLAPRASTEEGPTLIWPNGEEQELADDPKRMPVRGFRIHPQSFEASLFVGRGHELESLTERLKKGGSCAVSGPPGIGKTAILQFVCSGRPFPAEAKVLFAYLDVENGGLDSASDLHNAALAGWYGQLLDAPSPQAPSTADFARQIRTLRGAGFRPVFCIDRFESLLVRSDRYLEEMMEDWQTLMTTGQIAFLISTREPVVAIFKEQDLATGFARSFYQVKLGLLQELDARELLQVSHGSILSPLPDRVVDVAMLVCGRHPFFLVQGGKILADHPDLNDLGPDQVRELLLRHMIPQWTILWEKLTSAQRNALATALERDVPLVVARQRRLLERTGLIEPLGECYQYFSSGFGEWITQQYVTSNQSEEPKRYAQ